MEKGNYQYEYPKADITADCVVFGFDGKEMQVLLIKRGIEPYKDMWALPGGFMHIDETIEECARRELREETGLDPFMLRHLGVYSTIDRDPRGRVMTVAFISLVSNRKVHPAAGDDAALTEWFALDEIPQLAFDHNRILNDAIPALRRELRLTAASFHMLGETFTLPQLHRLMEWAVGHDLDRRNFERKIMSTGLVNLTGEKTVNQRNKAKNEPSDRNLAIGADDLDDKEDQTPLRGRPSRLFALNKKDYNEEEDLRDLSNPLF